MGFRQINPAGGAAEGSYHDYGDATKPARKIIKWTDASWKTWKTNFTQSAESFWHGKFWLINDVGAFAFTKGGETYYPNVWCRFKLIGNDAGVTGNHHTIDVVRLHASENWFGSHSTLYDLSLIHIYLAPVLGIGQDDALGDFSSSRHNRLDLLTRIQDLGRLAPYLERPWRRLVTPDVSRLPRTM